MESDVLLVSDDFMIVREKDALMYGLEAGRNLSRMTSDMKPHPNYMKKMKWHFEIKNERYKDCLQTNHPSFSAVPIHNWART